MNVSEMLTPSDIEILANWLGIEINSKPNEAGFLQILSPIREEHNPSFSFNLETGQWKDFATGDTGDIVTLVERLQVLDTVEAIAWIKEKIDLTGALHTSPKNGVIKKKNEPNFWTEKHLQWIKTGNKRIQEQSDHPLLNIARGRDCLHPDTLLKYGCGIVEQWGQQWIGLPYPSGCQLYRRENGQKKTPHLTGSKPGQSWFGLKQTRGKNTLYIAKSPREVMLLNQMHGDKADVIGLCTGEQGTLSPKQRSELIKQISTSNYSSIYIFLDCDTAEAEKTIRVFANRIHEVAAEVEFTGNIRLVNIHEYSGGQLKDITDCIRAGMMENQIDELLRSAVQVPEEKHVLLKATKATPASGNNSIDHMFDISSAPRVPAIVYENLPRILKESCSFIEEDHQKDVFLVASLPVMASHMPKVLANHVDGYYTPDMFTLPVADPGAGKGIANKAKKMGTVLNKHLIENSRLEKEEYYSLSDKDKAKLTEPRDRSLFIPANSSSRAIYDTLDANGGWGLIFESEIDTMLNAIAQDWGNFSDVCRRAFHHESVSINRKGEHFFIDKPRLSICITGTFDQFKKMFESAENGHFSRYALYTFEVPRKWKSHRPTSKSRQLDGLIQTASENLCRMYKMLDHRPESLYIDLTEDQWQMIDDTFAEKMRIIDDLDLSRYLHASNTRTAVLALRMASMFTVLRTFENHPNKLEISDSLTPAEPDMIAAIWLADTFIKHAIRLYNILPKATDTDSKGKRYKQFVQKLPDKFKTAEANRVGKQLDTSKRTVGYWLSLQEDFERIKRGVYEKRK